MAIKNIQVKVDSEIATKFRVKTIHNGTDMAEVLRTYIYEYVKD